MLLLLLLIREWRSRSKGLAATEKEFLALVVVVVGRLLGVSLPRARVRVYLRGHGYCGRKKWNETNWDDDPKNVTELLLHTEVEEDDENMGS